MRKIELQDILFKKKIIWVVFEKYQFNFIVYFDENLFIFKATFGTSYALISQYRILKILSWF